MRRTMVARPDGGRLLHVRVQPRAARAGIAGWRPDGALSVRVTAAPVDGQANAAVGALLAAALGVRSSAVQIVRGAAGRDKYVSVDGLGIDDVIRRLGG
jgi:uncharacterized protein (TIGR00251 family)